MRISGQRRARHVAAVHFHSEQLLTRGSLFPGSVGSSSRTGQHRRIPVDSAPDPRANDPGALRETFVDGAAGSRVRGKGPEANGRGGLAGARADAMRAAWSVTYTGSERIVGVHLHLVADLCRRHGRHHTRDFVAFWGAVHQHQRCCHGHRPVFRVSDSVPHHTQLRNGWNEEDGGSL